MTNKSQHPGRGTTAVWGGEDGPFWERSTQVPVVSSVSFGYSDMEQWMAVGKGEAPGHIYSRNTNPTAHDKIEAAVATGCKLLYLESPTNPTLKVVDIERLAQAAHDQGAVVVVDNTFATPINQQPLSLGADLVLHSATKFLGGHADVLGGMERVKKLLPLLTYAHRAANLGAVETIAGPPAMTSHVECTAEERAAMGIPESLIRYSVGIEDVDDLIQDLDQALEKAKIE